MWHKNTREDKEEGEDQQGGTGRTGKSKWREQKGTKDNGTHAWLWHNKTHVLGANKIFQMKKLSMWTRTFSYTRTIITLNKVSINTIWLACGLSWKSPKWPTCAFCIWCSGQNAARNHMLHVDVISPSSPLNKADPPSSLVCDDWYWRVQTFIPGTASLFPPSVIRVKHRGQGCCLSDGQGKAFVPLDVIVFRGSPLPRHLFPCDWAVQVLTLWGYSVPDNLVPS